MVTLVERTNRFTLIGDKPCWYRPTTLWMFVRVVQHGAGVPMTTLSEN